MQEEEDEEEEVEEDEVVDNNNNVFRSLVKAGFAFLVLAPSSSTHLHRTERSGCRHAHARFIDFYIN